MLEDLKREVLEANLLIHRSGLAQLTWGNASGLDRRSGMVAIKPSGVPYEELRVADIVVLALRDGAVVEGTLRPSSDAPTHLEIYRAFPVEGICHTHSVHATMFCQARRELPCLGTTHADHFRGPVPLCRALTPQEVDQDYEGNTGRAIVERFRTEGLDPREMPAVLQAGHAPFTWGRSALEAVRNSIALETCAHMALGTLTLDAAAATLEEHLLAKHHQRKHGAGAYYGQSLPAS